MKGLFFFITLLFLNCQTPNERIFKITNPKIQQQFKISLDRIYSIQSLEVLSNSLNDTCKIGLMAVPPKFTGLLFKIEFYDDSLNYSYFPYKASSGELVLKHTFH